MSYEFARKAAGAIPATTRSDSAPATQKKALAGTGGFAAQEAALQPKTAPGAKVAAKGSGMKWPFEEPEDGMWDAVAKAFPGCQLNATGGAGQLKWSVYDAKTGKMLYVEFSGTGEPICGEVPPVGLTVTDDGVYWKGTSLTKGIDVVAKLKELAPPSR